MAAYVEGWRRLVEMLAEGAAQKEELATLYEISGALNSSLDLAETLGRVMDSLIRLTGAERGCLMLVGEDGSLEIQAARNFDQENIDSSDLEFSHTVIENVVKSKEPVLTTNAQVDPRFSATESIIGYNLRSIACVPLCVRERMLGALYLDNTIRSGVFSQADLPALTAFANQAAVAIENAHPYRKVRQASQAKTESVFFVAHELRAPSQVTPSPCSG